VAAKLARDAVCLDVEYDDYAVVPSGRKQVAAVAEAN
jgi:hypothetical protein